MPDDAPLGADDVLREEYCALRPGSAAPDARTQDGTSPALCGLCISGGGIRSATFGLGALQGLAEHGLLSEFDYLSTVSGGGYIGSWLTAWATRAGGIGNVIPRLHDRPAAGSDGAAVDPIEHLREYNRYLSPTAGALSSDLWTLLATIGRNIVLNWMVLVPLVLLLLMVPRLYLSILALPDRMVPGATHVAVPDYSDPALNVIGDSPLVARLLPLVSLALFATALFNILRYLPGVGGRHHTRADYTVGILAPLTAAVLTFLAFDSLHFLGDSYEAYTNLPSVVAWAAIPCLVAWTLFLAFDRRPFRERIGLVFGPMSLAIAAMAVGTGAATWLTTNYLLWSPNPDRAPSWAEYVTVGPPLVLLGFGLATVLFTGLSSRVLGDEDREWMSRAVAGCLVACATWLGLCLVVLILPAVALTWRVWGHGAVVALGAASAWITGAGRSLVPERGDGGSPGKGRSVLSVVVSLAPIVFVVIFGVGLSLATNVTLGAVNGAPWYDHDETLRRTGFWSLAGLSVLFLGLSWLMARYVNINTFSLHGMYRDRIVRAYLGASNVDRRPSQFTGFDRHDDMAIAEMSGTRPFHIVNVTLNLVRPGRLAWQQRKAASFTVTPLHCGSAELGYRESARYADTISLGTAVAISGAAASPNMGERSTPLVGFIMTLFNARLGTWLGNPGGAGARTWKEASPRSAIRLLVKEALGLTSDRSEYVYLSDGGHFENLGLYELIRRRCRFIVVLDSGCDPAFGFEDLGNALRKIRIDFGVPIDFAPEQWRLLSEGKRRSALATVRYSSGGAGAPDGQLLYIKPMLLGTEPPDVRSYAVRHPDFPHQSTADQWFDESQTESYRQLGLHTIREVCGHQAGRPLERLVADLALETRRSAERDRAERG